MRYFSFVIVAFLFVLTACNNSENSGHENQTSALDSLEALVYAGKDVKSDSKTAMNLVREYAKYYQAYQPDSLAVDRLFKAGEVSMGIGQGNLAVKYFRTISDDHSEFYKVAETRFLLGFCSENLVNDTAQARFFYNKFIEAHPEHHLAKDAEYSIQNLGLSDEDLIKMFEEKQTTKETGE